MAPPSALSPRVTHLGSVGAGGAGEAAGPLQALGAGRAALAGEAALALRGHGDTRVGGSGDVAGHRPAEGLARPGRDWHRDGTSTDLAAPAGDNRAPGSPKVPVG